MKMMGYYHPFLNNGGLGALAPLSVQGTKPSGGGGQPA